MPLDPASAERVVAANARFLCWCRAASIPVFHCVATYRDAEEIRANPGWRARAEDPTDLRNSVLIHNLKGSPGCTIIPEVFEVIDWPRLFNITPTPLEQALDRTFNDPRFADVVLRF